MDKRDIYAIEIATKYEIYIQYVLQFSYIAALSINKSFRCSSVQLDHTIEKKNPLNCTIKWKQVSLRYLSIKWTIIHSAIAWSLTEENSQEAFYYSKFNRYQDFPVLIRTIIDIFSIYSQDLKRFPLPARHPGATLQRTLARCWDAGTVLWISL